jgi:hypothetical protein
MRKAVLVLVAAFVTVLASASSWEGSAMIGTYGDFPASGYYAACNSFARNTAVEVVNLENGRSITVIITRTLDTPGVFMMLSVEAASALGVQQGRVARIRASEPRSAMELAPSAKSGSSFDPDLNPRLMAAQELKRLGYELSPTGPAVSRPIAPDSPAQAMGVPAPAPASPAPVVKPSEPRAPVAVVTPSPSATTPKASEKPSSLTYEAPAGAVPPSGKVPVAEPVPLSSERPVSVATSKLKPVRTIVLPQLPEPSAQAPKATAPAVATVPAVPEALAPGMPVPDETPLRVTPPETPKRYEAPSARPEISAALLMAPTGYAPAVSLGEPMPVGSDRALAYARNSTAPFTASVAAGLADPSALGYEGATAIVLAPPEYAIGADGIALIDPETHAGGMARVFPRTAPGMALSQPAGLLAWPELEADEIPEIGIALLAAPESGIPATSLAEGEIILKDKEKPFALALETPEYGAAETSVALADAEAEAEEVPGIDSPAGLNPGMDASTVELAEAEEKSTGKPLAEVKAGVNPYESGTTEPLAEVREHKPETTAVIGAPAETVAVVEPLDSPKEYIVALEPTGPKPPVAPPTTPAPVTKEPVVTAPVVKAPVATAAVEPAKTAPSAKPPVAAVGTLEKGLYYIQIGAFGSEAGAKDAALSVGKNFGAVVQKVSAKGKDTWRVFVGPLTRDESGVALVRVRALGFKDAFVKSGG